MSIQWKHVGGKFLVVAAAAMLGIGLGSAGPAQAAPAAPTVSADTASPRALTGCNSGNLCFWNGINFNDGPGQVAGNNQDWRLFPKQTCPSPGHTWSDCVSSLFNNGNFDAVDVYQNINYGGAAACIAKGTGFADLTQFVYPNTTINMNDTISSNFWFPACA